MLRANGPIRCLIAVLGFAVTTVFATAPADARPPKAHIVIDAASGQELLSSAPDLQIYPASLTKMMTLYLTFEAVRDGRLRLNQKVRVSRHASRQPASKLYLKSGQRVTVRSLIRATALQSATDAAMGLENEDGKPSIEIVEYCMKMCGVTAKLCSADHSTLYNEDGTIQELPVTILGY